MSRLSWNRPGRQVTDDVQTWSATGDEVHLVRSTFRPGAEFPVHSHPQEQITVVLEGTIEITLDGTRHVLSAGDVLKVPSNVPHGAKVVSDQTTTILEAFSPTRPDLDFDADF